MLKPWNRVAIYMEGSLGELAGKMGHGLLRYSPNEIVAVIDSTHAGKNVQDVMDSPRSVPVVAGLGELAELGADVLILGIAPPGGLIPEAWWQVIDDAVNTYGMSIVNGLHDRIEGRYEELKDGQWVWDIRQEPKGIGVGTGIAAKLTNKRILMIGTDMAIGKMTAGLELWTEAKKQGIKASFVATGQIGITIMGSGIPLDAIRLDYASGAVEREVVRYHESDWVIIEGQGALLHPGSSANLPLLRGSCPTHLILCDHPGHTHLQRLPDITVPPLKDYVRLYQDLAEVYGTFPRPKWVGIAFNTSSLDEAAALKVCEEMSQEYGMPVVDPVRFGCGPLVAAIQAS